MIALLKLVPFRDYLYAALAIAAVAFYNIHVHNLEVNYARARVNAVNAAVTDASNKLTIAAKAREDKLAANYADRLKQVNDEHTKQLQADAATHAADLQRLRQLAAAFGNSSGSATLGGAASPGASADSGGSSLIGLGYVSAELAAALHDARDDLSACYAERDSLTGK
jgi:hypothetical protein